MEQQRTSRGVIGNFYYPVLFLLIFFIAISVIYSVSVGPVHIPFKKSMNILLHVLTNGKMGSAESDGGTSYLNIIYQIRMPRVIFALLIGMGLSLCGIVMQSVVQNPLADPYIIGISSGGALGATFAILIGFGSNAIFATFGVAFGAFLGAVVTSAAVLLLSSVGGKATSVKLVLSGVVVGALCSSFSSLVIYFANNTEGIKDVTFWSMGSLASSTGIKSQSCLLLFCLAVVFFSFNIVC